MKNKLSSHFPHLTAVLTNPLAPSGSTVPPVSDVLIQVGLPCYSDVFDSCIEDPASGDSPFQVSSDSL